MLRRAALLPAVGVMLVGCVTNQVGTDFASVSKKVGPPRAGHSRVVLLQDKRDGLSMAVCACEVSSMARRSARSWPENMPLPIGLRVGTNCW